ncbi:MAG: DUF58 domain-containing protein [Polyangiaceae bacterium]
MIPTRRLAWLAAIATILALAAAYLPAARPVLFAVDAIIVVATLLDALIARGSLFSKPPLRIAAQRQAAAIFSVGRPNVVTIGLRNRSGRRISGIVADDPVADAKTTGLPIRFNLAAHEESGFRYEVTPTRRGPRDLKSITVRYSSLLGLVARQERTLISAHFDVYPDVHAARSLELLRRQGRQDARLGSLRVRGGDTEFERLRPYQRGDEVRHIDWRASARRDDATVRQYQAESNQNVVFAIDIGRSMRGESGGLADLREGVPRESRGLTDLREGVPRESRGLTSVDHAMNAALLAADVALRGGDRAGMMAFDDAPRTFLAPSGGRTGGAKLTRAVYALEAGFAATDYRAAMAFLRSQVRARSLFVVFTNLLEPRSARDLASSLRGLLPRHLPLCVLMRDLDVEALAIAPSRGDADLYVRAAAAEAIAWRDAIITKLRRAGVLVLDAAPADVTPELVRSYLDIKARRLL